MIEVTNILNRYRETYSSKPGEIEYSFKELINSDFWFEFVKETKDGREFLENAGSRIVLGVKGSDGEIFWDLIGLYCTSSEENPWKSPRYFKVAEVSEYSAFDDVVVVVNKSEIKLQNVHCFKKAPNCTKDEFILPLSGDMQEFVAEYGGLYYEKADEIQSWEEIQEL